MPPRLPLAAAFFGTFWALQPAGAQNAPIAPALVELKLPTPNTALFEGRLDDYFQPTVSGRGRSGMFGFVRSTYPDPPKLFNRFHEGIDIKPVRRDAHGEPLDLVTAAAAGQVVYVNRRTNKSNYGNYVVVEHAYRDGMAYTIYGHLADVRVKPGQTVAAGSVLGRLGYTGAGIDKGRAHLHFEFTVLINRRWAEWYDQDPATRRDDPNDHEDWNGNNLNGFDPVMLLKAKHQGRPPTLRSLFDAEPKVFTVRVPAGVDFFDFQQRFPWTVEGGLGQELPVSWDVTCNTIGTPLAWRPSSEFVPKPTLIDFDWSRSLQDSLTRGLVERTGPQRARLTGGGERWFRSLMYLPGRIPPRAMAIP